MRVKNPNIPKIITISFFILQYMITKIHASQYTMNQMQLLGPAHFSGLPEKDPPIEEEVIRFGKYFRQEELNEEDIADFTFDEYRNEINKIEREIANYAKILLEFINQIKQFDDEIEEIIKEKNKIVCIKADNIFKFELNFNGILDCIYLIVNDDQTLDNQIKEKQREKAALLMKKAWYKKNIIQSQKNRNELNFLFAAFYKKLKIAFTFDPDIRELSTLTDKDISLLKNEGIDIDFNL